MILRDQPNGPGIHALPLHRLAEGPTAQGLSRAARLQSNHRNPHAAKGEEALRSLRVLQNAYLITKADRQFPPVSQGSLQWQEKSRPRPSGSRPTFSPNCSLPH